MVEKSLVEKSVPALAEVINVTLFGTTRHDDESIMIGSSSDADRTVSDVLNNPITEEHFTLEWYNIVLLSICGVGILVGTYLVFHEFYSKKHGMKKLVDTIKGK